MPTTTIKTDNGEVEVDLAEHVPDGYRLIGEDTLNSDYVRKDYHQRELDRVKERFGKSARQDAKEELKSDPDFRKEVAAEFELDEEQRQEIYQRVQEEEVKPAREEAQTWRERFKREKILSAAQGRDDIDPKALKSIGAAEPLVVQALAGRVEIEDDGDASSARLVLKSEDGRPLQGKNGAYASIEEGLDELAEDESYEPLFRDEEPTSGSGFEKGGGQPSMSADDWDGMSRSEKVKYIEEHGSHPNHQDR